MSLMGPFLLRMFYDTFFSSICVLDVDGMCLVANTNNGSHS